jgi:hypothetical protein
VQATIEGPAGEPRAVTIAWGDGAIERVTAEPGGTRIRHHYRLAPGTTRIEFRVAGLAGAEPQGVFEAARPLYLRVREVVVADAAARLER